MVTRWRIHRSLICGALLLLMAAVLFASASAEPLASGQPKFLGAAYSAPQREDFAHYWNKLSPENAGKWGEVEAVRDVMDWQALDEAYAYARAHGMPFQFHVLVWGNQQPEWIRELPADEQRAEIEEWFAAVAARYSDIAIVEVVNEPLHDPPCSNDADGGHYCEALGGAGQTGWDWIIESFRLARQHFPRAQLLLNDYSITNTPDNTRRYRGIVDLLQARGLIDAIGVQGHAFSTSCETPLAVHRAALDLLGATGLPLYVTELDIDGPTDEEQLAHYQRVFPLFWEHPAVAGITLWGFRPGLWRHEQRAYLIDERGQERPALRWLRDYVAGDAVAAPEPCPGPASVLDGEITGALAVIDSGRPLPLLIDPQDPEAAQRAATAVRRDLVALAGAEPADDSPHAIIAGTLGHSPRIERMVAAGKLEVADLAGRWEAYSMQVVHQPEEGIERALVIVGADRRGTVFGLYELVRRLGVSPWTYWADVPIPRRAKAWVSPGRLLDAPAVRYRGIFINDEEPALGAWTRATFGGSNHRFYERVFELILRLKGNYLWPAMWGRAFYADDPQNAALADAMGVVIGTSHHEPMMRAHVEWARHGQGPWDYARNGERLRAFWREGVERLQGREAVVTLGMRGDGDEAMSDHTATDLLERIVTDQRKIIADVSGRTPQQTPQVWALYKEVQDYYDAGMRVPDDVTLLFADDNWGNLRRLPPPGSTRAGGYGVYYHFDYVGDPRSYKWLNTQQIERVWEQMRLAWAHGVDRLWIVNVGDIKPMELPISFFLDQAWAPGRTDLQALQDYPAHWAAEQFGPQHAQEIGAILTRYAQYTARRKPELLDADTYSLLHFGELERVLAEWADLVSRTQRIAAELPSSQRAAWYQLVEYPVLAVDNLHRLYAAVARNRLYAAQGRASAKDWADEARRLFARDAELARVYEQEIAEGKWIGMMSQTRIGYTHWQQPDRNVLPSLATVDVREPGTLGVQIEGDPRGWPQPARQAVLPTIDPHTARTRRVEAFNRGAQPLRYTTSSSDPWLRIQPEAGTIEDAVELSIDVDFAQLPPGEHRGRVVVRGDELTQVTIEVPVQVPSGGDNARGFIEGDGHVVIEAAHFDRATAPAGMAWEVIPNLGRTAAGVTLWPPAPHASQPGGEGARLEYAMHLHTGGEVELQVHLSPTLDLHGSGGLRYAVSIGDEPPQIVQMQLEPSPGHPHALAWERAVADNVYIGRSRHQASAGPQVLKLWRVDSGLVFQRIALWRAKEPPSYLGPLESPRR
ncbi:MAG: glycosyl hydrolase 115 family protein [Xanthomonadales bacterium]|nr:glycosyl hydrolase 115 family protein [Xanthomonadales bacterium]